LFIYLGFVYYCGELDEQVPETEQRALEAEQNYLVQSGDSAIYLAILLVTLKALGIWLVYGLLESGSATDDKLLEVIVLPLTSAALDHAADIRFSLEGDIGIAWMSLVQSIFRTYFFIRPLAAFTGHNIDLAAGRVGLSVCTIATAIWLCIPGVPRKCFPSMNRLCALIGD
jgi:hypothetical protein